MSKSTQQPLQPVIHRDRTFEHQGETWRVQDNRPHGYALIHDETGREVHGDWRTFAEVRKDLRIHAQNNYPIYEGEN